MVLTVKHQLKIYRKFELDIWGLCYTTHTHVHGVNIFLQFSREPRLKSEFWDMFAKYAMTPLQLFFYSLYEKKKNLRRQWKRRYIYRLDTVEKRERRKKINERFASVRITRLYFLTFQDYQFRKLFRRATKMNGNLETNYCYMLECRLLYIVYRSNYLSNPFEIMDFVKDNNVYIDFEPISTFNYLVPIGKLITFGEKVLERLIYTLIRRLKIKAVLFTIPRYMFISYQFHFFYLLRFPRRRDLIYPITIDIQRLTGYY